ncbi:MAG: zinc transporter ZupT [Oscillospiraceae bacterium]|nr:zinc transporter ZupT [Oscillospiraceae bacterium]
MNDLTFAFMLTIIAGLATGIGGMSVLFSKVTNKKFLSICLSFSAGVMLYVAFTEIFLESLESLEYGFGKQHGYLIATLSFFSGIGIMAIIDKFLPHDDHDDKALDLLESDSEREKDIKIASKEDKELKRTGVFSAIAIAIHNFPEGIITFLAAMYDPALGIAIAIAIILHNIPEGIAVAAPIYHATGSKWKAFLASMGAGLTEPLGALIAWLFVHNIFDDVEGIFGIPFAVAAGIMVFVAIHKLLPAAQKYGKHHVVMKWLFLGMAVMALSLVALEYVF